MEPETTLESTAWTGRGFNPKSGILTLDHGRLRYAMENGVLFDAPVSELGITWPWYSFGCQFWAHLGPEKHFISLMHTNNTLFTWWQGIKRGRRWKRAIMGAMRRS